MAIHETSKLSKKYRILDHTDPDGTKWWNRLSFWTKAADVEFTDGNTAQTKVGAIKGITTSTAVTETGYAADASVVSKINTNLNDYVDGIDIRYNSTYSQAEWSVRGADTWSPFNNVELLWTNPNPTASFAAQTVALDLSKYDAVIIHASSGTSISVLNSYWCFGTIIRSAITQRIHSNDWAPDNRVVSMSDTGLVFQIGYNKDGTQSSGDKAKPIKIYGVRKFEPTFPS